MLNEKEIKLKEKDKKGPELLDFKPILEFLKMKKAKSIVKRIRNKRIYEQFNDYINVNILFLNNQKYYLYLFPNKDINQYFSGSNDKKKFSIEIFFEKVKEYANERVISFILNLSSLQVLSKGAIQLNEILLRMPNLTVLKLNLFDNNIGNYGVNYICQAIKNLTRLTTLELNLENNQISFDGVRIISNMILSLVYLSKFLLSLSDNRINVDSVKKLYKSFASMNNLRSLTLQLSFNYLGDGCVRFIADSLQTLNTLKIIKLYLNNNDLTEEVCMYLLNRFYEANLSNFKLYLFDNLVGSKTRKELKQKHKERLYI